MTADPALDLTVAYLGLNGYFLVSERELHVREHEGYRTLTDIDVIAIRPPSATGPAHHGHGPGVEECLIVTETDPTLGIDPQRFDVIVGEVKTADAELNPALRTPGALHAALRHTGDLYHRSLDVVVDELIANGSSESRTARVRLMAFAGHGKAYGGSTIHLRALAVFIRQHLHSHQDLYRVTRFSDPVIALLELLEKATQEKSADPVSAN